MTAVHDQSNSGNPGFASLSLSGTQNAGDTICVLLIWASGTAPGVPTDTAGNTYTLRASGATWAVYDCESIAAGSAVTVTCTLTGNVNCVMGVSQFTGMGTFDTAAFRTNTTDPTPFVSFTPSGSGETAICLADNVAATSTLAAGASYTSGHTQGNHKSMVEYRIGCPSGAQNATWNNGGSTCCTFVYSTVVAVYNVKGSTAANALYFGSD